SIAVCSSNRAPSRAPCSTASDRSPDEAKASSISACSRSVGDTRGDMGVGPSSKTWQVLRGTYALVIYTVAGARPSLVGASPGLITVTVSLPARTVAFCFYGQPKNGATFDLSA